MVALAAGIALGLVLYVNPHFTGEYGQWLRQISYGKLGLLTWILPPALAILSGLLLLGRSLRAFLRAVGFTLLGTAVMLPVLSVIRPEWGGELGALAARGLTDTLGNAGLLLCAVMLAFVLDMALRKRPGWLFGVVGRRVGLAASRLSRSIRLARRASRLLGETRILAERYPEHKALAALEADLAEYRRNPLAGDATGEGLEALSGVFQKFLQERSTELASTVRAEVRPLAARLERLSAALATPVQGLGLAQALEERRAALSLEVGTLHAKARGLERQAEQASALLERGVGAHHLLQAWDEHQTRLEAWEALQGLVSDLEQRADGWLRWAEWLEANPPEAHSAGLRALLEGGLSATPPVIFPAVTRSPAVENLPDFELEFDFDEAPEAQPVVTAQPKAPPSKPPTKAQSKAPIRAVNNETTALALPTSALLDPAEAPRHDPRVLEANTRRLAETIDAALKSFNVEAKVVGWARGPTVTRFELEPAPGEKISRVANLANDLARALAAGSVRIEAPIPGKSVIGLEVPNAERDVVRYSEGINSSSFVRSKDRLPLVLGKSIDGEIWVRDLAKMPHLLIAGSTGSGKSVAVNTLISSLLFKFLPTELRFLMIDPKMVELTPYEGIPHLIRPVVTNPADAAGVLLGAVAHMERRYKMMSQVGARNLEQFNEKMKAVGEPTLPYLVIVIDELADLMITAPKEVEQAILRLAQMARATGMHLILATQRPSVDILTSLIKVNIPARMAFAVSSGFDSRTILDTVGAERLVGQGDMLYHQPGLPKPVRLQGPYLSEGEVHRLAEFLRQQSFEDAFGETYGSDFDGPPNLAADGGGSGEVDFSDPLLRKAAEVVIEEGYASVSRLQRRLSVGHARAGKLVDSLEAMGIVGPHQGSKPREVLITRDQLPEYFGN
jgi:S-DNA-T family DNA segregation ATPase FtsK/SpoIIIE|nr:DNA translocase FtsK [Calidithermus timidus]